jgi:hypothetical protein
VSELGLVPKQHDGLGLDGDVERQLRDSDRRPGVSSGVSPEFEDEVAEASMSLLMATS